MNHLVRFLTIGFLAGILAPSTFALGSNPGVLRPLFDFLFLFFQDSKVIIPILGLVTFSIAYLLSRRILEAAGKTYKPYTHKIATGISTILTIILCFAYWSSREVEGFLRAILIGWHGFTFTILGTLLLAFLLYHSLHRWHRISMPPNP